MHIAVDIREALRTCRTGKGVWVFGLIQELLTRDITIMFLTDTPVPASWKSGRSQELLITGRGLMWHIRAAAALKNIADLDAYLSTVSYIIPAIFGKKIPCVTVIHDLIAFRNEPHDRKAVWIERLTLGFALQKSKKILTISESTKHDLLARYPALDSRKVTTVFAGPLREDAPANHPTGNFILCAATLCPRKNQKRLIQAFAALPEIIRSHTELILIGGRGWHDQDIIDLVLKTPGVIWKNYVDDREYEELLNTCTIFALPSLYEGFGMPILDAMQRGIPVLTSDRGSLKEVAGEAALIVDPDDTTSIAQGLQTLLTERNLQETLRKKGPLQAKKFTWKRTADLIISSLNQLRSH